MSLADEGISEVMDSVDDGVLSCYGRHNTFFWEPSEFLCNPSFESGWIPDAVAQVIVYVRANILSIDGTWRPRGAVFRAEVDKTLVTGGTSGV